MLTYATLASGIEAVSIAWAPLGFTPVFFAENAPFPSAVLKHHWPAIPNLGDLTTLDARAYRRRVNILWGSFPCQDWSLAGKRAGAAGDRGALTLAGVRIVDEIDPDYFCFENVEGILSDKKNAFGAFLGLLVGESSPLLPPGGKWTNVGSVFGPKRDIAWRTLDAKYSGVAQQRRRVFLVAVPAKSGRSPSEILFEKGPPSEAPVLASDTAFAAAIRGRKEGERLEVGGNVSNCLRASQGGSDKAYVIVGDRVRLLTPIECERLMGLPDNHTLIPWRGGAAPDSRRYHAIGNSLVVPEVRWIGERIAAQDLRVRALRIVAS